MRMTDSSKVVVFSDSGIDVLKKYILVDIDYIVFDPVTELKKGFFTRLRSILRFLINDLWKLRKGLLGPFALKFFYKHIRARILLDRIEALNPSCIITYVDNYDYFHAVSRLRPSCVTIAIQNGARLSFCATKALPTPVEKYCFDEFYCFGQQTQELFQSNGHEIGAYIKCGSLLGGHYFSKNHNHEKVYDICLVSQWFPNISNKDQLPKHWHMLEESFARLLSLLSVYSEQKNIKICVALRTNKDFDGEKIFFKKYLKSNNVDYYDNNRESFSSYELILRSNVTISSYSTLALEAFGAGEKVLFVNPLGLEHLKPLDITGDWYISNPNQQVFNSAIDKILNSEKNKFCDLSGNSSKYVMSYDFNRPLEFIVRDRLKNLQTANKCAGGS